jgi:hypothetical protein
LYRLVRDLMLAGRTIRSHFPGEPLYSLARVLFRQIRLLLLLGFALLPGLGLRGEERAGTSPPDCGSADSTGDEPVPAAAAQSALQKLGRWFEVQNATLSSRYRFIENSSGFTTSNHLQHREIFKGRFKFDPKGRLSLNAGIFSGRTFVGGWNNTGWGTGDAQANLALKQLYLSAALPHGLSVEFGGLYLSRGRSTEITTYDDDSYIVGERVALARPHSLFFDEISVTYAYLGDTNAPNLLKRFDRLGQSNYHQFLVAKKISDRLAVSADYTFDAGRETLRQAIELTPRTRGRRILDLVRFESYERMDVHPDYGFAAYGERALTKRLTTGFGYAQIDPRYGGLNGDRFGNGNRFYLMSILVLFPEFSVSVYLTRAFENGVPVPLGTRLDIVFSYNLLRALKRLQ